MPVSWRVPCLQISVLCYNSFSRHQEVIHDANIADKIAVSVSDSKINLESWNYGDSNYVLDNKNETFLQKRFSKL